MARGGDNHHDLSATYQDLRGMGPSFKAETGLYSDGFPGNRGMPRRVYTKATVLADLFEGSASTEEPVRNVCLHEEAAASAAPLRSFDIDSVLAFPRSFAAFRQGFRWCPAKQVSYNIQTDVHVERQVEFHGPDGKIRRHLRHLRDIPHLYLGSVDGFRHGAVYLFFPWLIEGDRKFTYLADDQAVRFFDRGMWPACRQYLEEDRVQHFPPTQRMAELNARAKGMERQTYLRERGLKQYATYPLQPDKLHRIWETLQARIRDPANGLGDFRDGFLLVNVKGVKMDFKVTGSLAQAMGRFEARLAQIFHFDLMDQVIQDIGGEVCPPLPGSTHGADDPGGEALVYLWKRCCLERQHRSLLEDGFDGKNGRAEFFHVGFLRDAAGMTLVPPKRCWIRQGGWLYGQWYASEKEIVDAQTCHPFGREALDELAIDAGIWKANVKSAKLSHVKARESLVSSYHASKVRARQAYRASETTSFGVRMEFRVDWHLFQAIKRRALDLEARADPPCRLPSHPPSVWPLTTRNYARFMLGNYEKFTSALEIASITSPQTGVPLERTRLMIVLIKALRGFASSDLARESTLWYHRREVEGRALRGLGLESTIAAHGFGWFHPAVNWEDLRFEAEISGEMVGLNQSLLSWYRTGSRLIRDTAQELTFCFERLETSAGSIAAQDEIVRLMAHLCFRQFRRDVLTALAGELRQSVETDEDKDAVQFCYEGLREAFVDPPNLVSGNKTKTKHPAELMEWLWGSSDGYNRKHFEGKPFRIMYQKVRAATRAKAGVDEYWHRLFRAEFLAFHWILPYPDINGTLISTAKGTRRRQWWAIDRKNEGQEWTWAKDQPRLGRPGPYPRMLEMTSEELVMYLDRVAEGLRS